MPGYDISAMTSSPEWQKMPPEQRDRIMRKVQARNAAGTPPPAGPTLPVFTGSSVETAPVKVDPNAPDFVRPAPPEAEPAAGMDPKTAQLQQETQEQTALQQAHPTYQKFAGPASDITGRLASAAAQANVAAGPGQAVRELTGPISYPAQKAGRELFPQTPEEAGFDTAIALITAGETGMAERSAVSALKAAGMTDEMAEMMGGQWIDTAMRAKRAGIPIRMATAGIGRGVGSVAGGGPFWGPAAKGATYQGLGELGAGGIGLGSRYVGEDWLIDRTVSDLGQVMSSKDVIPELAARDAKGKLKIPLGTPGEWEYAFSGDDAPAVKQVGNTLANFKTYVKKQLGGMPFMVQKPLEFTVGAPGAKQTMKWTFDRAEEEIDFLNKMGYSSSTGFERHGVSGENARALAYDIRNQLAEQLNKYQPGLGDEYLAIRKRYGLVKDISRAISDKSQDIFGKREEIQGRLQKLFGQGNVSSSVVDMLGPDARRDILTVIRRGVPDPAYDQPSRAASIGVSAHPGGVRPHISMPHAYHGVGGVPWVMNPPAGPFGLATGRTLGRFAPYLLGNVPYVGPRAGEMLSDDEGQQ